MRVLVTGASRGVGLGICEAFAERGDHVIATCRRSTPELDALDVQVIEGIELTSDEAVATLPDAVGPDGLDVLIYNAGVNNDARDLEGIVMEDMIYSYDANTLGAVRVVLALLPLMQAGSKIMLVGVGGAALNTGQLHTGGSYGYRMAKAALTSFGFGLGRDLRDRGIAVVVSSPGPVATDMAKSVFSEGRTTSRPQDAFDIHEVGHLLRDRVDEMSLEDSPNWQRWPNGELVDFTMDGAFQGKGLPMVTRRPERMNR